MHLAHYLGLLHRSQEKLGQAFREVGEAHRDEHDVFHQCRRLARQCDRHAESLAPFAERYGEDAPAEPDRLHATLFEGTRFLAYRQMFLNHIVHHRAQLGVYLRLNSEPVPATYGPSADETLGFRTRASSRHAAQQ